MRALLTRLEVQFVSRGCGLRQLSWDSEGQVLGKKGDPGQKQRTKSRKREGAEKGVGRNPRHENLI